MPHKDRLRVLHVITRLVVGGAQENTLLTLRYLDRERYHLGLACGYPHGPEGSLEDAIPRDIDFFRIPKLVRDPAPVWDVLALIHLCEVIRRGRYQIVHTHTTKAGVLGRIAARLARVPIVVHTPHGHAFHSYLDRSSSAMLQKLERWLAGRTDRVICLTETERTDHLDLGIGGPELFTVIHSGVDVDRFMSANGNAESRKTELGLPGEPLIGCVARLVHVKGVDVLLEAFPKVRAVVPNAHLVFVGDGPMRGSLERRVRELSLDGSVTFLGLRRDVADIMPLFDVFVLPSRNEGMGKVLIEAMAAGKPVVASRTGGIKDLVDHGRTGLLVTPGDFATLSEALIRVLTDQDLAARLSASGRTEAPRFSVPAMVAKIDALYGSMISTPYNGTR